MRTLLCLSLLVVVPPSCLAAMEFHLPAREVLRSLFEKPAGNNADGEEPAGFALFALGSLRSNYPYEYYAHETASGGLSAGFGLFWWLALGVAAQHQPGESVGVTGDARFQFLFVEAGGEYRHWYVNGPDRRLQMYSAWLGGNIFFPFSTPFLSLSQGFGVGNVVHDGESHGGLAISARALAFPLWPLSLEVDSTLVLNADVTSLQVGVQLGVMAFRHFFVEVGYRALWVGFERSPYQSFTLGIAFYTRFDKLFGSPQRPNTW